MKYDPWIEKSLVTWIKDNRRSLFIAFAIFGPVIFYGGRHLLVSSWIYKNALAITTSTKSVNCTLGEPIEPGFWVTGTVRWSGPMGSANIAIPVSGPKEDGVVVVVGWATKRDGAWAFDSLNFEGPLKLHLDLLQQADQADTNKAAGPDQ